MSPSAMAQYYTSKGQFTRSYFAMEKGPETAAMKGGTAIHALVEAGIIKAQHVYQNSEKELKIQVPGTEFYCMGRPDDYGTGSNLTPFCFVDYKSGKANGWEEKLPTDVKMRMTAWLVWMKLGQPSQTHGFIEFIQTTWDPEQKKVVPIDDKETEIVSIVYSAKELDEFTKVIANTMRSINELYEKWKQSTGEFVNNQDIERYVELKKKMVEIEAEADEVGDRILAQMEFGGEENHKTKFGTFFIRETKTYDIPKNLSFKVGTDQEYTLEQADVIISAAKAAESNYKLANEPSSSPSRKVNFRPSKDK